jgi:LmbE family N-acetylglucosaminyl deacetylase
MKPTPNSAPETAAVLAFGAHPDDLEFGCGGVIAAETAAGRAVRLVVCSRGESATQGTPAERTAEAEQSAALLGAALEFLDLGGDAHFERRLPEALKLASIVRRVRPRLILAPSPGENQHPDHARLGQMVRDAARLARYGGVAELRPHPAHAIDALLFYAVTPEAEPPGVQPILVDVSAPATLAAWTAAMRAHATQAKVRNYAELHLARARVFGLRAGVGHAQPLWPNDPLLFPSLGPLGRSARSF